MQAFLDDRASVTRIALRDKITGFVLSLFIHQISLKHNRETTASNLFQASLLSRVVGEFHFSF